MTSITEFTGENRWLSNFAHSPIIWGGLLYQTVEHAYQAAKTNDPEERERIRTAPTASSAKRLGKTVKLRPDWEDVKLLIMESLLRQKFADEPFRTLLINTGEAHLEEGNYWGDTFWGVCRGQGSNHLGRLLMQIREEQGR